MVQATLDGEAWKRAFRFSLANAIIFLMMSLALFFWQPQSLFLLLLPPAIFFVGAVVSFIRLVRNGGVFAAIAWFVLGAGLYFGLGVVVGGLAPSPLTIHFASETVLYADLARIGLLNSSSILIVLVTAMPFAYSPSVLSRGRAVGYQQLVEFLVRIYPLMAIFSLFALTLQFVVFPAADNLLVRTFITSFSMIVLLCCLSLGMLWPRLPGRWRALGIVVFLVAAALAMLSLSKLATMSTLLVLVVGRWAYRRTARSVVGGLILIGTLYVVLGGVTNDARVHSNYDPAHNSPAERLQIIEDTIDDSWDRGTFFEDAVLPRTIVRFSVVEIQGYLLNAYDQGNPGSSLDDFWAAAIPRVLWPDKPIVTRFGPELHLEFWNLSEASSALAPTYTGEAYWNYGPIGLVLVSILLGLEFGWLTYRWHFANRGLDPAFFLVAFPVALWATFVENWIAASYIGGFLTIVGIWIIARFFILKLLGGGPTYRAPRAEMGY